MVINPRALLVVATSLVVTASAQAAIVGSVCNFAWVRNGVVLEERNVICSALLPEYYRAVTTENGGYAAFSTDLSENTLTILSDVSGVQQFIPDATQTIRITLPTGVLVSSFTLAGVTGITGFAQDDLFFEGRTLKIRMNGNAFASGAGRIDMTFGYVPAPGAIALLAAGGCMGSRRRRG
ncbi:MAG: hypothetical protein FJ254_09875 [Phycisphaerae bacterium]|nr:hypothetical protein [Phycisphaerae bacterium]